MENISLESKLDLFSNYLNHPERIDVNCEIIINLKVNKFISATLVSNLIYDYDTKIVKDTKDNGTTEPEKKPRIQLKNVFGVGLSYKF